MKTLTSHINEALKIGKNIDKFSKYSCQPKTVFELKKLIDEIKQKEVKQDKKEKNLYQF